MEEFEKNTNAISDEELCEISGGKGNKGVVFRYWIKPGDCLSDIAGKYHVDMWHLAQLNGIKNPDSIDVGKLIYIPYTENLR